MVKEGLSHAPSAYDDEAVSEGARDLIGEQVKYVACLRMLVDELATLASNTQAGARAPSYVLVPPHCRAWSSAPSPPARWTTVDRPPRPCTSSTCAPRRRPVSRW